MKFVAFALCLMTGSAVAMEPVPATVDKLIASPWDFDGKAVVVRGQVNNCNGPYCSLCPENMTDKTYGWNKCVSLVFDDISDPGANTKWRANKAFQDMFRYATVTLKADFDADCASPNSTCGARVGLLYHAVVQRVHARKTVNDGIIGTRDYGKLTEANAVDRAAMLAVLSGFYEDTSFKTYILPVTDSKRKPDARGLGCFCVEKSCEGRWPARYVDGFDSLANPFRCRPLIKLNGSWILSPEDF